MTSSRWLFWHRKDLRIRDNLGLIKAIKNSLALTGVYVLDPKILLPEKGFESISAAKIWFLTHSLLELQENWRKAGSRLIILWGEPTKLIPRLARTIQAEVVIWNKDIEPYNRTIDEKVISLLKQEHREVITIWDQLIVAPEEIYTKTNKPYEVFTPFWKNWHSKVENKLISGDFKARISRDYFYKKKLIDIDPEIIPSLDFLSNIEGNIRPIDLLLNLNEKKHFAGIDLCPCRPGEDAAYRQFLQFTKTEYLFKYSILKDIPYEEGTSKLSAALNIGTISPRLLWQRSREVINNTDKKEEIDSILQWQKEITWREFYQHALFHFPEISHRPHQKKWELFPWINNSDHLKAWENGLTGFPIIDAAMRQLLQSGWMHNRCRMIVASFLVKDLVCDWKLGEKIFLENLVDGDLAANNGGWQWSASCGLDRKPLRIFNPHNQAKKFDPQAKYIKKWVPELNHISPKDLISGNISNLERKGYPEPLVNHKDQQAIFKLIYTDIFK